MIKCINSEYYQDAVDIWQACFGDSKDYIERFFKHWAGTAKAVAWIEEGHAVSVIYLLPAEYRCTGKTPVKIYYMYAVATLPAYQKRGYCAGLIKWISDNIKEPVILVPADEKLAAYYRNNGFCDLQNAVYENISACNNKNKSEKYTIKNISPSEYAKKRNAFLGTQQYIRWEDAHMEYIIGSIIEDGGFCLSLNDGIHDCICTGYCKEDSVIIEEILTDNGNAEIPVQEVLAHSGCKNAKVCIKPHAMISKEHTNLCDRAYFNLTMG